MPLRRRHAQKFATPALLRALCCKIRADAAADERADARRAADFHMLPFTLLFRHTPLDGAFDACRLI